MSEHISQHLQISSPSSTAVDFTISSRTRKSAKAVTLVRHILRLIVASYTALATITKLQMTFSTGINQYVDYLLQASLLSSFLRLIIDSAPWWVLSVTSLLTLYLCVKRDYTGQWTYLAAFISDIVQRRVCLCCKVWAYRPQQPLHISFLVLRQRSYLPHRFRT